MKYNQKLRVKIKKVINRRKGSKILSKVKPIKNIKNLWSFLEKSSMQKVVLHLHKLQDHAYE